MAESESVKREPSSNEPEGAPPAKKVNTGSPSPNAAGRVQSSGAIKREQAPVELDGPITMDDIERFQKEALYRQLNIYKRERDCLEGQLDALKRETDTALEEELKAANERYLAAAKALERAQSFSLRRCAMDVPKSESHASDNANTQSRSDKSSQNASAGAGTGAGAGSASELTEKLATLESELVGLRAVVATREKQLIEQDAALTLARNELCSLKIELSSLSETELRKHHNFVALEISVTSLGAENKRLESELIAAQQALAAVTSEQEAYEVMIKQKYEASRANLVAKLENAEADVARLRTARDDVLGELNAKKASEAEQVKSYALMKELAESVTKVTKARDLDNDLHAEFSEEETVEQLKARVLKLSRQNAALAAELPALEQAFANAQAKALVKVAEQASVEAKVNAISASKARADEKYFSAMRARDAVAVELLNTKKALARSAAQVAEYQASETQLGASCQKLRLQASEASQKVSLALRTTATAERARTTAENHLEAKRAQANALQSEMAKMEDKLRAAEANARAQQAEAEKMKKQMEVLRSTTSKGTSSQGVQEQLEALRSIALCSLCTKNWKDTAIKLCGHVFCHGCAQERLDARMRKCPLCNMQFGQNDLLSVHL